MGALEANTTLIYGVHVRESANDGSDFSNAAADYRVLFLGEDGLLHLKDSSGTVTTPSAGSGSITASGYTMSTARLLGRTTASSGAIEEITVGSGLSLSAGSLTATGGTALVGDRAVRSAGDVTVTGSTNFTDLTGMSVTVTTGAHKVLVGCSVSCYSNNSGGSLALDIDLDGARLGGSTGGIMTLSQHSVANEPMNGSFVWMTAALSAASHTFKIQGKTFNSAHSAVFQAADPFLEMWVQEMPF